MTLGLALGLGLGLGLKELGLVPAPQLGGVRHSQLLPLDALGDIPLEPLEVRHLAAVNLGRELRLQSIGEPVQARVGYLVRARVRVRVRVRARARVRFRVGVGVRVGVRVRVRVRVRGRVS